jgi:uncharacterized ion transporter superfamily protein YfcC
MSRDKVVSAVVVFVAFWLMFGVFALLGGRFDFTIALVFAAGAIAVGLIHRARRTRARQTSVRSGPSRP